MSHGDNESMSLYRLLITVAVCLFPTAIAYGTQSESAPLGMILGIDGSVLVERNELQRPAMLADLLFDGDRVITEAGEATLIFCPSTQTVGLGNNTAALLGMETFVIESGATPTVSPSRACMLPQVALGAESLEHVGALTVRGNPPVPLYLGGKISSRRPVFRWAAVEAADTYQLTLNDLTGTKVWEHQTTELNVAYPPSLEPLGDGDYLWELRAQIGNSTAAFQIALFTVDPAELPTSEPASNNADRLLRAMELEHFGYYADAAEELSALLSGNASDKPIVSRLAWLYSNAGLVAAADEAVTRLDRMP